MKYVDVVIRLVDIPAYVSVLFLMRKAGRRITLSGGLVFGGLSCLITGLVPTGKFQLNPST